MSFSYACSDYPGMAPCHGDFVTETMDELWPHIESHASIAHGEEPSTWPTEERTHIGTLIKTNA